MKTFLETTFGPTELAILEDVLNGWLVDHGYARNSAESEIAASVLLNLFREGSNTAEALRQAATRHKALMDLSQAAA